MFVTKAHHEEVVRQLEARISDLKEMLARPPIAAAGVSGETAAAAVPKVRRKTGVIDKPNPFDHLGNRIVPEAEDVLEQAATPLEALSPEVLHNPRLVIRRASRNMAREYNTSELENAVRKQFDEAEQRAKEKVLADQKAEQQSSEKVG